MWTYKQLEQQSRNTIKSRATLTRDNIGAERLPPFSAAQGPDQMIFWLLSVQCMVAQSEGLQLTPADFGAPDDLVEGGAAPPARNPYAMASPFGTEVDVKAAPQRQPMNAMPNGTELNERAMAHENACYQAQQTRLRNQGSNIFG